jgi:predicted enzyme related to lactoylglutathione lyase
LTESKTAKNRCHVDLHTESRDAVQSEVTRLVGLGATVLRPPKEEYGAYWATLQDPEGNELCIGAAEPSWPGDPGEVPERW